MPFNSPKVQAFLLKKWCVDKKYAPLYVEFLQEQGFTKSECEIIVKAQNIMSQSTFKRSVAHYINTEHLVPISYDVKCENEIKQTILTNLFSKLKKLWRF